MSASVPLGRSGVPRGRVGRASFALAALRFAIAALLLVTGAAKLADVPGFADALATYRAFPDRWIVPLAAAIPAVELLLAAWMLSGRKLFGAGAASAALHLGYAILAATTLARGVFVPNCGCFGAFLARPLTPVTVAGDAALVAGSIALAALSRRTA